MASVAMRMLPSVPFLKPMGADRPDDSSHHRKPGAPRDEVTDVLRRDHVEELAACRHAELVDLGQQLAGDAQAFVDLEALIEVRVVDETLPPDGGAWLFEVDAHHDLERAFVLLALDQEAARVLDGGDGVVDGTRAHDDQQAIILAAHDVLDVLARARDQALGLGAADREEADQVLRRRQRRDVLDALVVGLARFVGGGRPPFGGAGGVGIHGEAPGEKLRAG
jgi:hypothetical protein